MVRPKRSTCAQYAKSPELTNKVSSNEVKDLQTQFLEFKNVMVGKIETLVSLIDKSFSKINANFDETLKCNCNLKEVLKQTSNVQQCLLENSVIIITYEESRRSGSYCSDVLSKLKIARKDIIGSRIIFANGNKVIYKVELANKFIVSHVLQSKTSLRGSKVYIHRPYTDVQKVTRDKQIKIAKDIALDKKFRIYKDKLFINSSIYQWSDKEETFTLCNTDEARDVSLQATCENSRPKISVSVKAVAGRRRPTDKNKSPKPCSSKNSQGVGFLSKVSSLQRSNKNICESEAESSESNVDDSLSDSSDEQEFREVMGAEMREALTEMFDEKFNAMTNDLRRSFKC